MTEHDTQPGTGPVLLPVIGGPRWFDAEDRPFVLRIECPLAAEEIAAALYAMADPAGLASAEEACGSVAAFLMAAGLRAVRDAALAMRRDERGAGPGPPGFLAACRARVQDLSPGRPAGPAAADHR